MCGEEMRGTDVRGGDGGEEGGDDALPVGGEVGGKRGG